MGFEFVWVLLCSSIVIAICLFRVVVFMQLFVCCVSCAVLMLLDVMFGYLLFDVVCGCVYCCLVFCYFVV